MSLILRKAGYQWKLTLTFNSCKATKVQNPCYPQIFANYPWYNNYYTINITCTFSCLLSSAVAKSNPNKAF